MREPYHFKPQEDIAHLLADACLMNVCDLVPFGATVAGMFFNATWTNVSDK